MQSTDQTEFSTGCSSVDDVLNGGFRRERVVQIYGESSSGKTNICSSVAAGAAQNGNTVLIMSKDKTTFARVREIVKQTGSRESEVVMTNVLTREVTDFDEQDQVISEVRDIAESIDMVIFDGIGGFYRVERAKDESEARVVERRLTRQVTLLRSLARKHGFGVVMSNQVYYQPDEEIAQPLGGAGLENWFDVVLRLEAFPNSKHSLLVEKHRHAPEGGRGWFTITDEGVAPI